MEGAHSVLVSTIALRSPANMELKNKKSTQKERKKSKKWQTIWEYGNQ